MTRLKASPGIGQMAVNLQSLIQSLQVISNGLFTGCPQLLPFPSLQHWQRTFTPVLERKCRKKLVAALARHGQLVNKQKLQTYIPTSVFNIFFAIQHSLSRSQN